ncbi:uncharacterized protein LOC143275396 [Babylonia areolata]|uniref:uncharacterized protein LOC143275396 n=1 Tax=Babylonia areolata TaxID=304850 RepID=UPI003FD693EF
MGLQQQRGQEYFQLLTACTCGLCVLLCLCGVALSEDRRLVDTGCAQTVCQDNDEVLRCASSQLLVTNVTSAGGEADDVMLRHVKRTCMGQSTCDVSDLCKNRQEGARVVSYFCVQNTEDSRTCTGSAVILAEPHGFLQNPDYPAPGGYRACHWRIEPQAREAVHLRLFDMASVHRNEGRCDGGLHVSAYKCGWPRQTYTKLLCAGDSRSGHSRRVSRRGGGGGGAGGGGGGRDGVRGSGWGEEVTLVSCGPVDVRLTPARHAYPLRFWLGFSVTDSVRTEELGGDLAEAGLLAQCPAGSSASSAAGDSARTATSVGAGGLEPPAGAHPPPTATPGLGATAMTATTMLNHSVTSASGASGDDGTSHQDSTMTVLIILVCVIGFIALVLSVVLIVVCLRRRRPKVELIEHVYAVPSTCQTLSHTYLGDDDDHHLHHHHRHHSQSGPPPPGPAPRPRPRVQAYSDVADARPPDQPPQVTPASPAYAEVEDVADGDDKARGGKRFHFRFRTKRPSVSSTGGASSLYEDVNPLPCSSSSFAAAANNSGAAGVGVGVGVVSKHNNPPLPAAAAVKNNTLPRYSGSKMNSASGGPFSTGGKKGGRGGGGGGRGGGGSPQTTVGGSPVYVHVVDSADVGSSQTKSSAGDNTAVAPLAAKFIANVDKSSVDTRGKTDYPSKRLYPLQEGRVATLVSTLNRKKEAKNGVTAAKEQSEGVS